MGTKAIDGLSNFGFVVEKQPRWHGNPKLILDTVTLEYI